MSGRRQGPGRVLVAGAAYCDLIFTRLARLPAWGEEMVAERLLVSAGGSAITAIALARLGYRTALLAPIGSDTFGYALQQRVAKEQVDLLRAPDADTTTPVSAVLSSSHDRAFVTDPGSPLSERDLLHALTEAPFDHLHIAGFGVALVAPQLATLAHTLAITTSFDPGWDATALQDPRVQQLFRSVDIALPNRMEAEQLLRLSDPTPEAAIEALHAARPQGLSVLKGGSAGAWAIEPNGNVHHLPAEFVPEVIDPTGAGDVFDAGFLDGLWSGLDLLAALRRGHRCAARSIAAVGGAEGAPTRAELTALEVA